MGAIGKEANWGERECGLSWDGVWPLRSSYWTCNLRGGNEWQLATLCTAIISPVARDWASSSPKHSMPISPARVAAFEILLRVERENAYASELLPSARYSKLSPTHHGLTMPLLLGV